MAVVVGFLLIVCNAAEAECDMVYNRSSKRYRIHHAVKLRKKPHRRRVRSLVQLAKRYGMRKLR